MHALRRLKAMICSPTCRVKVADGGWHGAIVERIERGYHAAAPDPDEAGAADISRGSLFSWRLELCLGKEKVGAFKDKK
jgi:hypothetical protein